MGCEGRRIDVETGQAPSRAEKGMAAEESTPAVWSDRRVAFDQENKNASQGLDDGLVA